MKSICIIVNKYPNPLEPNALMFVQQFAWTLSDKGINCIVICPVPININPKYITLPRTKKEITENGNKVIIFFPRYIGFGQSHYILGKSPAPITTYFFTNAINRIIKCFKEKPDAIYGHFVTPAGIAATRIGRKYDIPSFIAHGESTGFTIDQFGPNNVRKELQNLTGVIAVSNRNKNLLLDYNVVNKSIIKVFPNGYREERFYPRDKQISRNKFGFPLEAFIIGFVGTFNNRKGILRLESAVEQVDDVFFACVGKGDLNPKSIKCILSKPIDNSELPYFYSAIDVFVLPTLNEGCCNAIIEAMACGLPIISSNLSFNDDIIDDSCSIRINPSNIQEIKSAIELLKNNKELCHTLAIGSLKKAKNLTLKKRVENICAFIDEKIQL